MYWYNQKYIKKAAFSGGFLLLLCTLYACKPDIKDTGGKLPYFDLKTFFSNSAKHLNKTNPAVNKTVVHNTVSETKTVHIGNWTQEFNLFIQSDINKAAWKNSYTITQTDNTTFYTARTLDLKTRKIVIKKDGNKVKWILIFNHTKNILYETNEKLSFFPDSLYLIQKSQKVRVMARNYYSVQGSIIIKK